MAESAGEKTEKATPKKKRDAREKGQVLKSTEVNTAFCSIVMFAFMLVMWPTAVNKLSEILATYLNAAFIWADNDINWPFLQTVFTNVLVSAAGLVLPVLLVALVVGVLANVLQVGFLFTTKTLAPKLERISPLKGFKRIFSMRTLTELIKSILKIVLLGYILYSDYVKLLDKFPTLMGTDLYVSFIEIMKTAFTIALKMACVMVIIAAFDFLFQWYKFDKDMRMTKQEVKDEYKLTEGDPQIKSRIRQKQRQMSAMRMMEQVPGADVIITNPTHYAIALKYDDKVSGAPMVIAKGQDYLARKIKDVARENGIYIVENKPLARSLYDMCEVGNEIPPEFYKAVADILVYVYRQKKKIS